MVPIGHCCNPTTRTSAQSKKDSTGWQVPVMGGLGWGEEAGAWDEVPPSRGPVRSGWRRCCPEEVLKATRKHWHVENQLHWVLDVSFGEDQCRARQGYAAENLATTRQIALNLLKQETSIKLGIKNKRKACGWDDEYLFKVMGLIK